MIRELLESIPGVANYPIISLLLFFSLFVGVVFWAFFKLDKQYIKEMANLPLDSSNNSTNSGE